MGIHYYLIYKTSRAELPSSLFSNHTAFTPGSNFLLQRSVSIPRMDPPIILGKEENMSRASNTIFSGTV